MKCKNGKKHEYNLWSELKYYWDGVYLQKRHCRFCGYGQIRKVDINKIKNDG